LSEKNYVLNKYAVLNNARSSSTKEKGLTPSDVCGGEALRDVPRTGVCWKEALCYDPKNSCEGD